MELLKTFKRIYVVSIIAIVLSGIMVYWLKLNLTVPTFGKTLSYNIQQILIILVLIGLPGVLLWSSKQVKILKEIDAMEERLDGYKKVLKTRLLIYSILAFITLFIQLFTQMEGVGMFFMIILVMFVFIWPTRGRFMAETGYGEETENE
jgi:hypothetical protein